MDNALQKAISTYVPVTIPGPDVAVEKILFNAQNFSTRSGGVLLMMQEPTKLERKALMDRQALLVESMFHDRVTIKTLIAQMLAGFAKPIKDNETTELVLALFVHELGLEPAVPTWAVAQACSAIRNCSVPEIASARTYPRPSTIAVRQLALRYAWKAKAEMVAISEVLAGRQAAPQVSPADRAKVARKFRRFADEMIARQRGREILETEADAARLRALVGDAAFDALPAAQRRSHRGQIGSLVGKSLARA